MINKKAQHFGALLSYWPFLLSMGAWITLPLDSVGFTLPKLFCIALAGSAGAFAALRRPQSGGVLALATTWTGWLLLLFFGVAVLSPLWSIAPILSIVGSPPRFQGVLTQVSYAAVALGGMAAAQTATSLRMLVRSILAANAVVVAYGTLQIAGIDPFFGAWKTDVFLGRVFSTIGQPTMLANVLLVTLPFVAWQAISAERSRRLLYGAQTFCTLAVMFASASRAAMVGFLAAMVLWVLARPRRTSHLNGRRFLPYAAAVLVLAGVAAWSFTVRFRTPTQYPFSLGSRGVIWAGAASMAEKRPAGYGLDTVGLLSPRFLSPSLYNYESLTTTIDDVHSEPLQILLTLGWAGLVLFYGFLGCLCVRLWRHRAARPLRSVLLVALVGVHVSLLGGVIDPVTGAFSWLTAGMGLGVLSSPSRKERHSLFARHVLWSAAMGSFLAAVFVGWWIIARFHHERSGALLFFSYDRQMLIENTEAAELALEEANDAPTVERLHRSVRQAVEHLSALTNMHDGMSPLLLGWQAAIRGDDERAAAFFTKAREMRTIDITVYRIAAHGYALLGDDAREQEILRMLIALLPHDWNAPSSPRGRILRKEHPWLQPLLMKRMSP